MYIKVRAIRLFVAWATMGATREPVRQKARANPMPATVMGSKA